MANTYQLIQAATVGSGGVANIEFTSIPQTYTDLVLKLSLRASISSVDGARVTFNNSTSGYSYQLIYGNSSGAFSYYGSAAYMGVDYSNGSSTAANIFSNGRLYISNYTGSNHKLVSTDNVTEDNSSTGYVIPTTFLWSNTSAITSIKIQQSSGTIVQYSTAYLYGISNA